MPQDNECITALICDININELSKCQWLFRYLLYIFNSFE